MEARICIQRDSRWHRDGLRAYRIEIDGERVGKLRRGATIRFPVAPGEHDVRATIDWAGSALVSVTVTEGAEARLVVRPGTGLALPAVLASSADVTYLDLRVVE